GRNPYYLSKLKTGELVRPALWFVHYHVNGSVSGQVTPMLVWDWVEGRSVFRFVPKNLRAALWWQFAQAVEGNRDYHRCPVCGRWFERSPGVNRADRQTCSPTCRTKAYRQRQEAARRLHAEGKTLREIAHEVGSTVANVRKWVTHSKG